MNKAEIIQTKVAERSEGGVFVRLYSVIDIGENTREWYYVEHEGRGKLTMRKYSEIRGAVIAYKEKVEN